MAGGMVRQAEQRSGFAAERPHLEKAPDLVHIDAVFRQHMVKGALLKVILQGCGIPGSKEGQRLCLCLIGKSFFHVSKSIFCNQ